MRHLKKESCSFYAALLMNLTHTESSEKGKKATTLKLGSLAEVVVRDDRVDILETTINRF